MPRPLYPPSSFIPSTVRWHVFLHVCLMSAATTCAFRRRQTTSRFFIGPPGVVSCDTVGSGNAGAPSFRQRPSK